MKNLKITRELIKAVLQKETETLTKDFNFIINEDYIEFSDDGEMQFEHCIYKFAFKCKEWAHNKGYIIKSLYYRNLCIAILENAKGKGEIIDGKTGKTEIEAIIKACIWILENKDNK